MTPISVGIANAETPRPLVLRDFDGDGGHDLLFRGRPGTAAEGFVRLVLLDGLLPGAIAYPPTAGGALALVGSGDVDGDGVTDLVFQGAADSPAAGTIRIDILDPVLLIAAEHHFLSDGGGAWRVFDVTDLDGDGREDLVLVGAEGTAAAGAIRLVVLDGGPAGATSFLETRLVGSLAGLADLDDDGRSDLVTQVALSTGGFELRAYFTGPDGISVTPGPTRILSNPGWKVGALGRDVLEQFAVGPGAVALLRSNPGDTLHEMLVFAVHHYATLPRGWRQVHVRYVTGAPPVETLGLAKVNDDGWSDVLMRFDDGCWVERSLLTLPIRCGPAFRLASAGDVDGDGRADLLHEGVAGTAAFGMLRIDRSGPTGFAEASGWIPTGGGVWELLTGPD